MSIALERGEGIEGPDLVRQIPCFGASDLTEVDRGAPTVTRSSSIGKNSDLSTGVGVIGEDSGEAEVQSSYNGPLETMDSLEKSLPIR